MYIRCTFDVYSRVVWLHCSPHWEVHTVNHLQYYYELFEPLILKLIEVFDFLKCYANLNSFFEFQSHTKFSRVKYEVHIVNYASSDTSLWQAANEKANEMVFAARRKMLLLCTLFHRAV